MNPARWLREPVRDDVVDLWPLHEVVHEERTPFQDVLVARTPLGTTLFCDQNPQSAEVGQLAFHEAELVPALALAGERRRVLVIGCSEGVVPQIAARAGVEVVDHVDIDPDCVRICAEHLPYGFDADEVRRAEAGDGPIRLHYDDGARFVRDSAGTDRRYDVIVLDLPEEDEDSPHSALYQREFLTRCRDLLAPGGVVSTHVSRPHLSLPAADSVASFRRPWQAFGEVFATRAYFRSDEQPWAAIMLGRADEVADPVEVMTEQLDALAYRPRTLDALTLRRAACLPGALREPVPTG